MSPRTRRRWHLAGHPDREGTASETTVRHEGLLVDLVMAALFLGALWLRENPTAMWFAVAYLFLGTGDLLRRTMGVRVTSIGERVVLAAGGSIAVTIILTLLAQSVSPWFRACRGPSHRGRCESLWSLSLLG